MFLTIYLKSIEKIIENKQCECCEIEHECIRYKTYFTHVLNDSYIAIAKKYKLYKLLWEHEKHNVTHATHMISPLKHAAFLMISDDEKYAKHHTKEEWVTYRRFIKFIEDYLNACLKNPKAKIYKVYK